MYNTNQTALAIETKRTNTYLTGSPNCQTTDTGTQIQARRTYDFSVEVGTVNYTEIGFSWTNTGANTTFSRILLPSPVPGARRSAVAHCIRIAHHLQPDDSAAQERDDQRLANFSSHRNGRRRVRSDARLGGCHGQQWSDQSHQHRQ
jgi:hypothetical protein